MCNRLNKLLNQTIFSSLSLLFPTIKTNTTHTHTLSLLFSLSLSRFNNGDGFSFFKKKRNVVAFAFAGVRLFIGGEFRFPGVFFRERQTSRSISFDAAVATVAVILREILLGATAGVTRETIDDGDEESEEQQRGGAVDEGEEDVHVFSDDSPWLVPMRVPQTVGGAGAEKETATARAKDDAAAATADANGVVVEQ